MAALNELSQMDSDERQYNEWGRAFEFALARDGVDIDDIQKDRKTSLAVAQRLLNNPLKTMPFMLGEQA